MGLKEYFETAYDLVSKWWKYSFLFMVFLHVLFAVFAYFHFDGLGELGEFYFKYDDRLFYVGFME